MGDLDEMFQSLILKQFDEAQLAFMLVVHKLEKTNIILTDQQRNQLQQQISEQIPDMLSKSGVVNFELDGLPEKPACAKSEYHERRLR